MSDFPNNPPQEHGWDGSQPVAPPTFAASPTAQPGYAPQQYQPYQGQISANPFDSRTTPVLVLGILGLVFCPICGPFAWVMGNRLRDEATAAGYPEPQTASVGRILGIVGTVMLALSIALLAVYALFFAGLVLQST